MQHRAGRSEAVHKASLFPPSPAFVPLMPQKPSPLSVTSQTDYNFLLNMLLFRGSLGLNKKKKHTVKVCYQLSTPHHSFIYSLIYLFNVDLAHLHARRCVDPACTEHSPCLCRDFPRSTLRPGWHARGSFEGNLRPSTGVGERLGREEGSEAVLPCW